MFCLGFIFISGCIITFAIILVKTGAQKNREALKNEKTAQERRTFGRATAGGLGRPSFAASSSFERGLVRSEGGDAFRQRPSAFSLNGDGTSALGINISLQRESVGVSEQLERIDEEYERGVAQDRVQASPSPMIIRTDLRDEPFVIQEEEVEHQESEGQNDDHVVAEMA